MTAIWLCMTKGFGAVEEDAMLALFADARCVATTTGMQRMATGIEDSFSATETLAPLSSGFQSDNDLADKFEPLWLIGTPCWLQW